MSDAMEISQEALETIGSYVRKNLPSWLEEVVPRTMRERDLELRERTVRVEEELKAQRELMAERFEQVDKRFEQVDKRFVELREDFGSRFEQIDKRFDDMHQHTNRWMTAMLITIGLIGIAVTASNLLG